MANQKQNKYWLVSVNMGYGHLRAAYPLLDKAHGDSIIANDYQGIPVSDRNIWTSSRKFYERISRLNSVPLVGHSLFELFDWWQEIPPFYPRRDLSKPGIVVKEFYRLFERGYMRHLIEKLGKESLPMVNTFFLPALAADYYGYKGDIYCIITDTDFSRAWVALDPPKTRIKYFAPTRRAKERLRLYGVPDKNIILTGFPLPKENVGLGYETIKADLTRRLVNLDPSGHYLRTNRASVCKLLGEDCARTRAGHPLTVMFAVGGAGAQRAMVGDILESLSSRLKHGHMRLILVAGSRSDVNDYFREALSHARLNLYLGKSIQIIYSPNTNTYFRQFNRALHTTDILWTKPSELSFYVGLGLPIIMAPPIGSQEEFNEQWLRNVGAGIPQRHPRYVDEWLDDMLHSGWLARAAVDGFTNAPKRGAYRIEDYVAHRRQVIPEPIEPI